MAGVSSVVAECTISFLHKSLICTSAREEWGWQAGRLALQGGCHRERQWKWPAVLLACGRAPRNCACYPLWQDHHLQGSSCRWLCPGLRVCRETTHLLVRSFLKRNTWPPLLLSATAAKCGVFWWPYTLIVKGDEEWLQGKVTHRSSASRRRKSGLT